jgi:Gas vesicle synthesis protein GvpL/GvpF
LGDAVRERLDLVRGREQMTLRVTGATGAAGAVPLAGAADAGRRYLEQVAARRVPQAIQPLIDVVRPLVRATRIEGGAEASVVTVYQLVDRGAGTEYLDTATRTARNLPQATVLVSGPSPAYAFADLGRLR